MHLQLYGLHDSSLNTTLTRYLPSHQHFSLIIDHRSVLLHQLQALRSCPLHLLAHSCVEFSLIFRSIVSMLVLISPFQLFFCFRMYADVSIDLVYGKEADGEASRNLSWWLLHRDRKSEGAKGTRTNKSKKKQEGKIQQQAD